MSERLYAKLTAPVPCNCAFQGAAVALNQSGAHWPKSAHVAMAVVEFIESYCNRRRPHSTIGYRIPAEAMDGFFGRTAPHVDGTSNQDSGKLARAA